MLLNIWQYLAHSFPNTLYSKSNCNRHPSEESKTLLGRTGQLEERAFQSQLAVCCLNSGGNSGRTGEGTTLRLTTMAKLTLVPYLHWTHRGFLESSSTIVFSKQHLHVLCLSMILCVYIHARTCVHAQTRMSVKATVCLRSMSFLCMGCLIEWWAYHPI